METAVSSKESAPRLIEVYRALYFDARADLNAKDNIARIAKNMIERTFGATLAELTSLEEMLKTMQIEKPRSFRGHQQALGRLLGSSCHLCCTTSRRHHRSGHACHRQARDRLGADRHASARRSRPIGARDVVLAKYTCVALQRVSGSVKKVKGALSDESVRYPMTNPLFGRLRAAIQMSVTFSRATAATSGSAWPRTPSTRSICSESSRRALHRHHPQPHCARVWWQGAGTGTSNG